MEQLVDPLVDLQNDIFFTNATPLVDRELKTLLPVRNQGRTNACYAFATTATMYGDEIMMNGSSTLASPKELFDYLPKYKRPRAVETETGPFDVPPEGYPFSFRTSFGYVKEHGLTPETVYPWSTICKFERHDGGPWDGSVYCGKKLIQRRDKIFIEGYVPIELDEIEETLDNQPVTGVLPLTRTLRDWKSDAIYTESVSEELRNTLTLHAITVVAYGREGDVNYLLCQNSYGLSWGHRGYIKVKKELVSHTYIPVGTRSPRPGKGKKDHVVKTHSSSKRKGDKIAGRGEVGCQVAKKQHI